MAKRTDRVTWGLVVGLAVLVLGGIGLLGFQFRSFNTRQAALLDAAQQGDAMTVRQLLSEGVPADRPRRFGLTPLMIAAAKGHTDNVQVLLSHGAKTELKDEDLEMTAL